MKRAALCVGFALLAGAAMRGLHAQTPSVDKLRILAEQEDSAALIAAVRENASDARECVRRLIIETGRAPGDDVATLTLAGRLANAYEAAWQDPFLVAQVGRFARMNSDDRAKKIGADSIRRAGNAALARAGVRSAMALWRESLRRSTAIADTASIGATLGNIGAGFYRASQLDSAEAYLGRARDLAEIVGDRQTAVNAVGTLGSVAKDRGDLRRAQELYGRALELRSRNGDARGAAADHNNLGLLSVALGNVDEARSQYKQSLSIARQHSLDEPAAAALLNLGNVASAQAEYAEAADRYGEALSIYRSLGYQADVALVLHNLGYLALRRGDYGVAKARLNEAYRTFARVGAGSDMVIVERDLASVAMASGDLRGAMTRLRGAEKSLARQAPAPELTASLAMARADLALQLNNFPEAERQFAQAAVLYRRARNSSAEAEAKQGGALLLLERGQDARALELLKTVARTQASANDRRPRAITQLFIGYAQHRKGDLADARRTLGLAVDSLHALNDAVGEAAALAALADVELEAGSPAAESLYRRGLMLLKTRPASSVSWQLHAGLGRALGASGALSEAGVELRAAVQDVEGVSTTLASEDRRAMFLVDKWDVYAQLAMVERAQNNDDAAFATSERMRARQMLAVIGRGRVASRAPDSSIALREQDLRRQIGELTERLKSEELPVGGQRDPGDTLVVGGAPDATREALARAQDRYAQLLLDLREDEPAQLRIARANTVSWREVASRLTSSEALVEYLVSDSATIAFVVTRDTIRTVNLDVGRSALESLIDFARGTLVRPQLLTKRPASVSPWRSPLQRLHEQLVAPLERANALAGVKRLIIVPHAELHYLPFAALLAHGSSSHPGRDDFLIERYEIAYAPSASVWVRLEDRSGAQAVRPPGEERVLALAPHTSALPGSREEVETIRASYGSRATVLVDNAASEAAFRALVAHYDVVHLATFGTLNSRNPLFSRVSLNADAGDDGQLEVHEVFGLELHARLLVLSACQTALGSGAMSDVPAGDDWVGLVQAFLGVGARNVIATLWPVEDRSTANVMARLYGGLRAGQPEVSALAAAQRQTLLNAATADPFYWAGFVLVGTR
jgi:CHAT domain-containing protein